MSVVTVKEYQDAFNKMSKIDQAHVFRFWQDLNHEQKHNLFEQIALLTPDLIQRFSEMVVNREAEAPRDLSLFKPFDVILLPKNDRERKRHYEAFETGEKLIRDGKVGIILVAGGQGTRLGYDGPKGTYRVGPISERTLYHYHLEKVRALEQKYGVCIPLYIMTSRPNHEQTVDFFAKHQFFDKEVQSVLFIMQRMLPAFDKHGKILMDSKYSMSLSPDGHGGLINALGENDIFQDMEQRDIEFLFYFQVDNVMAKICDPAFIGYHAMTGSEFSAKTVYKRDPFEKLGNIGILDGRCVTIEYFELPEDMKTARTADGRLKYGQGSIAIHVFNAAFLKRMTGDGGELPYHLALKNIKHIDQGGRIVQPPSENGLKIEQFIFDAFPFARKEMVMETSRAEEFSPIKNAEGEDSIWTARQALSDLFGAWLEECGAKIERNADGHVKSTIEISPLYAPDVKTLCQKLRANFKLNSDLLLE